MASEQRYVPRKTDRRLGMPENPKPTEPNDEAPNDCWIECVDGHLRHSDPGDWIDYEGDVHCVQAGAPNVLSVQEVQLLLDRLNGQPVGFDRIDLNAQLERRLSSWANEDPS